MRAPDAISLKTNRRLQAACVAAAGLTLSACAAQPATPEVFDTDYKAAIAKFTPAQRFNLDYAGGNVTQNKGTNYAYRQSCFQNTGFDPLPGFDNKNGYLVTPANVRLIGRTVIVTPAGSATDKLKFTGIDDPATILQPADPDTVSYMQGRGCNSSDNTLHVQPN